MSVESKLKYKEEGLRRMKIRKNKRIETYIEKSIQKSIEENNNPGCKVCGEYPYCYCGDY
jgi:hypothetical protein